MPILQLIHLQHLPLGRSLQLSTWLHQGRLESNPNSAIQYLQRVLMELITRPKVEPQKIL
jgi:hypothetical protein